MKRPELLIIGATFLLVIGGFFVGKQLYEKHKAQKASQAVAENRKRLAPDYAPQFGSLTPKVQLVEFLDPECESCRAFYPEVKKMMKEFDGEIQLVIRYAAFHPHSRLAIKILEASRKQERYLEVLETLFKFQPQWGSHHDPRPELLWTSLQEARVDVERIRVDILDEQIGKNLEQDLSDARDLMITATPTFFVNGRLLEVFSAEALRSLIREELSKISENSSEGKSNTGGG
jgi:protein-disulfide isomerase